jgi:hypothetical protein
MSADALLDRRGFVAGCLGAAGLLLLPTADAAIEPGRLIGMSVFVDPEIEAAVAFGAALSHRGAQCHSLCGDRYRLVRSLLSAAESPATVAGMGTYADFIVATDVLREARYAALSYGLHSLSSRTDHRCFGQWSACESALHRSNAAWPATLADVIAGRATNGSPVERSTAFRDMDGGTVLSWVMRSRGIRRIT